MWHSVQQSSNSYLCYSVASCRAPYVSVIPPAVTVFHLTTRCSVSNQLPALVYPPAPLPCQYHRARIPNIAPGKCYFLNHRAKLNPPSNRFFAIAQVTSAGLIRGGSVQTQLLSKRHSNLSTTRLRGLPPETERPLQTTATHARQTLREC